MAVKVDKVAKPVIKMTNINKSYGKGENKVDVLKEVSLTVDQGEFVAILGPSGSGKTTLMNLIGLIDTIDNGDYFLDEVNIKEHSEKTMQESEMKNRVRFSKIQPYF